MRLTVALFHKLQFRRRHQRLIAFNNKWHDQRERKVENLRIKEDLVDRGYLIHQPEEVVSSHLPPIPELDYDYEQDEAVMKEIANNESHPLYQERPVWSFDERMNRTYNYELDVIKSLTKSISIKDGLPDQILEAKASAGNFFPNQPEVIGEFVKETFLFDGTQKKQPRRVMVPYTGWHPVNSKMSTQMPYPITHSYQWKERIQYGIPVHQRNLNLMRGLFRYCDYLSVEKSSLLQRGQMEKMMVRQFFERNGKLARIYLPVPMMITDPNPLSPFVSKDKLESETSEKPVVDIKPLGPLVNTVDTHVYRHENNFPIKSLDHSAPNCQIGVYLDNSYEPSRKQDAHLGLSLAMSFMLALGQARLKKFNLSGELEEPVTTQFIATNGQDFYFSAFQLNTLDLDSESGVKNLFWHQDQVKLFEKCGYEAAKPVLEGFNPDVFQTIAAMYLQNSK